MSSAAPLPGGRWLLVDDLVDSGATLVEVIPMLKQRHPGLDEIRSAVIWRKGASVAEPDYFIEYLPTNPWIHQPFEEYDHMSPGDLKARWG
jgi:hypoxanthine phosphoribosyltransferase